MGHCLYYIKIGTILRRLAWLPRKDDTQNREAFHTSFLIFILPFLFNLSVSCIFSLFICIIFFVLFLISCLIFRYLFCSQRAGPRIVINSLSLSLSLCSWNNVLWVCAAYTHKWLHRYSEPVNDHVFFHITASSSRSLSRCANITCFSQKKKMYYSSKCSANNDSSIDATNRRVR